MIQDILSTGGSAAGVMQFTALTPGPLSQAVGSPFPAGVFFSNSNNGVWFEPGDNIIIESLWIPISYGFGHGPGQITVGLRFQDSALAFSSIPEIAGTGDIIFPDLCDKLEFPGGGLYVAAPIIPSSRWRLSVQDIFLSVSQVNLPAALSGVVVDVQVFIMVKHTRPLSTVP